MSDLFVPQANPGASYRAMKPQIDDAVARVLDSGWYILGQEGKAFEAAFAQWLGRGTAVGCANGTDAIVLALHGLGIGPGSSVVTVSHTAVATVAAIEMAGATPILIDIEPDHYTMEPNELADVLAHPPAGAPPIRAVIPVHLYGQMADVAAIGGLCARHGAALIEDCAQAHGATWPAGAGMAAKAGTFGDAATFSFYPTKNLGALGDGGAVVARDPALARRIAALRQYGWFEHYVSDLPGVNSRLDEVQAAILRVALGYLDAGNQRRRAIAAHYDAALGPLAPKRRRDVSGPEDGAGDVPGGGTGGGPESGPGDGAGGGPRDGHVFHLYVIQVPDRDAARAALRARGVGTGVHYPVPVHRQRAYDGRIALGPSRCAETARAAESVLSLPIWPAMTEAEVHHVAAALGAVF